MAPGAGLGSAQRARELLCKSALMRRGPGVAGGQGWSSEGPQGDSPVGVCPRSGQLGQERARLCAACGPEQSVCSCCFSYFYFYFWKGGSSGWSSVGCPSSRPGHPCGGMAPAPRGSNVVTACGRGELGLGAALPSPSPCSPPAPFGSPPPPPQPLAFPSGRLCRCCAVPALPKGMGSALHHGKLCLKKNPPQIPTWRSPREQSPAGRSWGEFGAGVSPGEAGAAGGAAGFGLIC